MAGDDIGLQASCFQSDSPDIHMAQTLHNGLAIWLGLQYIRHIKINYGRKSAILNFNS